MLLEPFADVRSRDLCRKKFYNQSFAGQDLSRLKLRSSMFMNCCFDKANMSETDCEGSEFFGSSFIDTNCNRTNFKDAKLAGTMFQPKDCMGMTLTMSCHTFQDMKVSQIWFLAMLTFCTMMKPVKDPIKEDLVDRVINAIGAERYIKLKALFSKRDI